MAAPWLCSSAHLSPRPAQVLTDGRHWAALCSSAAPITFLRGRQIRRWSSGVEQRRREVAGWGDSCSCRREHEAQDTQPPSARRVRVGNDGEAWVRMDGTVERDTDAPAARSPLASIFGRRGWRELGTLAAELVVVLRTRNQLYVFARRPSARKVRLHAAANVGGCRAPAALRLEELTQAQAADNDPGPTDHRRHRSHQQPAHLARRAQLRAGTVAGIAAGPVWQCQCFDAPKMSRRNKSVSGSACRPTTALAHLMPLPHSRRPAWIAPVPQRQTTPAAAIACSRPDGRCICQ